MELYFKDNVSDITYMSELSRCFSGKQEAGLIRAHN